MHQHQQWSEPPAGAAAASALRPAPSAAHAVMDTDGNTLQDANTNRAALTSPPRSGDVKKSCMQRSLAKLATQPAKQSVYNIFRTIYLLTAV